MEFSTSTRFQKKITDKTEKEKGPNPLKSDDAYDSPEGVPPSPIKLEP